MPAYVLVEVAITDPVAYERYKALAPASIAAYGGRYLARGGTVEILEGAWKPPERLVILEFASLQQAKAWHASAEYSSARAARAGAAEMHMLVLEGLPSGA